MTEQIGNHLSQEEDLRWRDKSGRFLPGRPRNPNLKKGLHWKTVLGKRIAQAVTAEEYEELIRQLHSAACKGDSAAARLILEYSIGRPRQTPAENDHNIELPPLTSSKNIAAAASIVAESLARGEIDAEAARPILDAIEVARRAHEQSEIVQRLEALEIDRANLPGTN